MKKIFTLFAAVLMAGSMLAEATTVFSWDGNGQTAAITPVGGTVAALGGDASVVAGIKQKNNWCFKLGKTYMVESAPTHYVEITLATPLQGGESIEIGAFVSDATKNAILGINFDGDNELTESSEGGSVNRLTDNGAPTSFTKTVPAAAAGASTIRLYRQSGGTSLYVSKFVITRNDAPVNYWLVGTAAENGWDQTRAMPMPGDQITRHLAAGTYEFKVLVAEGSWDGALGFADLDEEASSANVFGDDNVVFELEEEGDVTIAVVDGQIVVTGNFKEQAEYDYYIKFAGNNWTWVGMIEVDSEITQYMYEGVWGGVGANVNTAMSDNGAAWYPEADIFFGNFDEEEADVPAVGTAGFYFYYPEGTSFKLAFYYDATPTALQNVEAQKLQKTIENGQVVILRDGKKFNTLGVEL